MPVKRHVHIILDLLLHHVVLHESSSVVLHLHDRIVSEGGLDR
jgi:hypothetical protein